jgi:beta-phosphoglucomutase family hydrolase
VALSLSPAVSVRRAGAVIFDMDGVLVDSNAFHRLAWRRVSAARRLPLSERDLRDQVFGWRTEEAIRLLWGTRRPAAEVARIAAEKERLFRDAIAARVRPLPGLRALIAWLTRRRVPIALASSAAPANVALVVRALNLERALSVRVLARDVRNAKPDPEIFLCAAARLRVAPADCVVIEDSRSGVTAAVRAGMRCVGITTTHRRAELRALGAAIAVRDFRTVALRRWLTRALVRPSGERRAVASGMASGMVARS